MRRTRRSKRPLDDPRYWKLLRCIRGADPVFAPERAAEALRRSRFGAKLVTALIRSREPDAVRSAAVYGLMWGPIKASEFDLLLQIVSDPNASPRVRGQAAEVLGPRVNYGQNRGLIRRRDRRACDAFVRGLNDAAPEVRFWSIFALAHPRNDWAIPRFDRMRSDRARVPGMWMVGQEASWAIRWIRGEDLDRDPSDF